MHRLRLRPCGLLLLLFSAVACASAQVESASTDQQVAELLVPVALEDSASYADLEPLARAIGDRRIVLLGENGHGVREFSIARRRIVRWLHETQGFDVLVFEAPLFECAAAYERLGTDPIEQSMRECLLAVMHHAELRPLFTYLLEQKAGARPLQLLGNDIQLRGSGVIRRPYAFFRALEARSPSLASTVSRGDSTLLARDRLDGDSLAPWLAANGVALKAAYDSAAAITSGAPRQWLKNASALITRERARSTIPGSTANPTAFYELRDEWMARNTVWAADSQGVKRKVVVWLHNDHGRYGSWAGPNGPVRAAGSFLREWRPNDVYNIGFLHGTGRVTNNSRRVIEVAELPPGSIEASFSKSPHAAGFLELRRGPRWLINWAQADQHILRGGTTMERIAPASEFDALFWIRSANPPSYRLF